SPPLPRSASTPLPSSRFVAYLTYGPLRAARLFASLPLCEGALNIYSPQASQSWLPFYFWPE
ncbi:hypothetical protein PIB30_049759, partial [Stylosanthes scabra]|nr:hypothetical protein [Stylosanthes scabra]